MSAGHCVKYLSGVWRSSKLTKTCLLVIVLNTYLVSKGQAVLPRHVCWSLSNIMPVGQEQRKPPAVLLHVWEQLANPVLHSLMSATRNVNIGDFYCALTQVSQTLIRMAVWAYILSVQMSKSTDDHHSNDHHKTDTEGLGSSELNINKNVRPQKHVVQG